MRSAILISRLVRAVETGGNVGDGAALAQQYAEAVAALNARLEAAQTALDAGQASEAVRLMEVEPKLVNEVGALDFHQLAPWRSLCAMHGWTLPPAIDQRLVERILEVYNGSAMLEPTLKSYRKAVRTRNESEIVQSLRRLAALEPANAEWGRDLARAEAALQKTLAAAFRAATDDEKREEVATDLLDAPWSVPPDSALAAEATSWRNRVNAERRSREQSEDLELLHKFADGEWNRTQAESILNHLDALAEQGTPVPPGEATFVESLRTRCADEARAEAEAARWTELMEALHAAVEHETPDEIRRVMAAPEFLDRPPDEELLRGARRVIRHAEEERRRKARRVVAVVALVIAVVTGVSAKLYADKMFRIECAEETANLERIAKAPRAHEALADALQRLKTDKPKVYASPGVVAYEARLVEIRKDREARIGRVEDALAHLEKAQEGGWEGDPKLHEEQFSKAKADILPEDEELSKRLASVELDFTKVCGERREAALAKAREELEPLVKESEALVAKLGTTFLDATLEKNLADFRDKATLWQTSHAEVAVEEATKLEAALAALDAPEKRSGEAATALARLNAASNAVEAVAARATLTSHYNSFQSVSSLRPLPFTQEEAQLLVTGTLLAQSRFASLGVGMDEKEYHDFLDFNVLALKEFPSIYSVYGFSDGENYLGFTHERGFRVEQLEPSRKTGWKRFVTVSGRVLEAENLLWQNSLEYGIKEAGVNTKDRLAPCEELRDIIEKASSMSSATFAATLWSLIGEHIRKAKGPSQPEIVESIPVHTATGVVRNDRVFSYVEQESDSKVTLMRVGRYPAYKRVQMVALYFAWLKAMGQLPSVLSADALQIETRLNDLATTVQVDDVDDLMTWVCLADRRIRARNKECAEFLASIPDTFVKNLRNANSGLVQLHQFSFWRAEFAGTLQFDPSRPDQCIPTTLLEVKINHPLYVLRKGKDGSPILRKLLVPRTDGLKWLFASGRDREGEYYAGEPLFQIRDSDGNLIDAALAVKKILNALPKPAVDAFNSKPFWIELTP